MVVTCPAGGNPCVVTVSADGTAVYDRTGGVPSAMAAYGSWGLPPGHGLGVAVITVAAGTSEAHGNVVVTCPPGGSACVVRVSADGAAEYARTGGIPTFMFSHPIYERENPTAEDLLDHWNEPERLRMALGLSAVAAGDIAGRKRTLTDLINAAGGDSAGTGTLLRNVAPEDIEIIGERDGITYGRWRGGPAGTLNLQFDWRFTPNLDETTRAMFERAGKSWSWRLADQFRRHTIERGTVVSLPDRPPLTLLEDVATGGLVIFMDHYDENTESRGRHLDYDKSAIRGNDFQPFLGTILLAQSRIDEVATRGSARLISLMAHEIAHVPWNLEAAKRDCGLLRWLHRRKDRHLQRTPRRRGKWREARAVSMANWPEPRRAVQSRRRRELGSSGRQRLDHILPTQACGQIRAI